MLEFDCRAEENNLDVVQDNLCLDRYSEPTLPECNQDYYRLKL
jgi:hypothetical protein